MISAWAGAQRLVLGQMTVADKSNEIRNPDPDKEERPRQSGLAAISNDFLAAVLSAR